MAMKVLKILSLRTPTERTALFLSVGLVVAGIYLLSHSQKLQKLSVLEEGIGTCFQRVSQTFTARMIGQMNSVHLNQGFTQATQECFGETVSWAMNATSDRDVSKLVILFNKLANEVSFFHAKIEKRNTQFSINNDTVQRSHLNGRFQAMESIREDILSDIALIKMGARTSIAKAKVIFYFFAFLCPLTFCILWWRTRNQYKTNQEVEGEARLLILSNKATFNAARKLIDRALMNNNLSYTKNLFIQAFSRNEAESKIESQVRSQMTKNEQKRAIEIERVWEESKLRDAIEQTPSEQVVVMESLPESVEELPTNEMTCELEVNLTRHLDMLSGRIFTQGIRLNLNIEELPNVRVCGKTEDIDQILYYALTDAMTAAENGKKELSVSLKQLGGIVLVNIDASGASFEDQELFKKPREVELQICRELIRGIGKVEFANREKARRIQLTFNLEEKSKGTSTHLSSVTKTTKREFKKNWKPLNPEA